MRIVGWIVGLGLLVAAAWGVYYVMHRVPTKQLETALHGEASAKVEAGQAGAALDAQAIIHHGQDRERVITERRDQGHAIILQAQGADLRVPPDVIARTNAQRLRILDADPAGGRGLSVFGPPERDLPHAGS